jgi:hypothetical protein
LSERISNIDRTINNASEGSYPPKNTDKETLRKLEGKEGKYKEESAQIGMMNKDKKTMNQLVSSGEVARKKKSG